MSDSTSPPDGGTPPTLPDGSGGQPEQVRNLDELRRIAADRDKYKTQVREIQKIFGDGGQAPPDGQNVSEVLQTFMANQKALETRAADAERREADATAQNKQLKMDTRQRILNDEVLSGVSDQHRDAVKLMIPGLLAEQKIDLSTAEDVKAQGKKCREKLSARFPGMFGEPGGGGGGGSPSAPRKSYDGLSWADLSDEEKANMSQEDFAKMVKAGGGAQPQRGRGALLGNR